MTDFCGPLVTGLTWFHIFTERNDLGGGGGVLPYNRLIGMCLWMRLYFYVCIDSHGVAFSIGLLECGRTFSDFWGKTVLHIYG